MTARDTTPLLFRPRRPRPLAGLVRAARWHRRKLAVLAALAAVFCILAASAPGEAESVPVVVAARDLDGGSPLSVEDLRVARYPVDLAPGDAVADPADLAGRHLIISAASGSVLTERSVVAPRGFAPGIGMALVPVRFDDAAVAGLLRVGDRVDVVASAADGSPTEVLATGARVLALPVAEQSGGPFGAGADAKGPLVLLEVPAADAGDLVQAPSRYRLTVVLR